MQRTFLLLLLRSREEASEDGVSSASVAQNRPEEGDEGALRLVGRGGAEKEIHRRSYNAGAAEES